MNTAIYGSFIFYSWVKVWSMSWPIVCDFIMFDDILHLNKMQLN